MKFRWRYLSSPIVFLWRHPVAAIFSSIVSFYLAALALVPRITVDASDPQLSTNALTSSFTVANNGLIPLEKIRMGMAICEINFPELPPISGCNYSKTSILYYTPFSRNELATDERYQITLDEILHISPPGILRSADIGIWISYRPWILPMRLQRIYRFRTVVGADGKTRWSPTPLK